MADCVMFVFYSNTYSFGIYLIPDSMQRACAPHTLFVVYVVRA